MNIHLALNSCSPMPDEQLDRLIESLAQINVNLEGLRVSLSWLQETRADHEGRLRSLERWRYHATTWIGLAALLLGGILTRSVEWLLSGRA